MNNTINKIDVATQFDTVKKAVIVKYCIACSNSNVFNGVVTVKYSKNINSTLIDIGFINNVFKVFLAQLFLIDNVHGLSCTESEEIHYSILLDLLYSIRNYEEGTQRKVALSGTHFLSQSNIAISGSDCKNVLNLISGGKDSFASYLILKQNNCNIHNCFINGLNIDSSMYEYESCKNLYKEGFDFIDLEGFDQLIQIASRFSKCLNCPPVYNSIPRGRDLLSITLVLPYVKLYGCSFVSHGCEYELWNNNIVNDTQIIPLHDSQSFYVIKEMNELLKKHFGIGVFSPIAGLHEYYILKQLLLNYPEKVLHIQSCFFDSWCGRCKKCLRYYLIQKSIQGNVLHFKNDPEKMITEYTTRYSLRDIYMPYCLEFRHLLGIENNLDELTTIRKDQLTPEYINNFEL